MPKKKKYMPLYYEWVEAGKLPKRGLCASIGGREMERLFKPSWSDGSSFWAASDDWRTCYEIAYSFNPLRQNIVLMMAALNGEL